jgi:hypothetical protein
MVFYITCALKVIFTRFFLAFACFLSVYFLVNFVGNRMNGVSECHFPKGMGRELLFAL